MFQVSYQEERGPEHKKMPNTMRGRLFVDAETNYYDWWHKYRNSWRFKTTRVSTTVDEDEVAGLSGERLKVGVINKNNVLAFVSPEIEPIAKDGEQVLFFEKVDLERKAEEKLQSRNEAQKNGAQKD